MRICLSLFPDIEECSSNPCKHGDCSEPVANEYLCTCEPGYTGADCETGNDGIAFKITIKICNLHSSEVKVQYLSKWELS